MRPNLNWNLLDSSWHYCLKTGRLREAREEGALWCQACGQEGGAGSGWGGSSWLRFQTATSEISICATWSTSFYNFDAAKIVWRLQLFPLDDSPLPNARLKLGEVGAHRASASQDDFWPRRRHADGENDVSSEGGSSDVNEENRGGRGHRRCHVRREANFRHTSTEGDRQGSVAFLLASSRSSLLFLYKISKPKPLTLCT